MVSRQDAVSCALFGRDFLSIVKITGGKTLLNLSPNWQTKKGQQTMCKELPPLPNMKTLQKMQPRCIPLFSAIASVTLKYSSF